MLAKRVNRIGLSTTLRISQAARALRADGVDVVDLSIGEPDFPTPSHVKDAAKRAIDKDFTRYTANEGTPELRRAIIGKLKRDNQLEYGLDEVLVSAGAKFSLYLATAALLESGQDVLIPAPYWVSYPEQVRLAGANPVFVPTREEDGFRLTPERLQSMITFNTKLLVLNYPSNPTGATYTREQLAALGEICRQEGIWILADEIYEKLSYDGHRHISIASISEEIKKRTIVINGVSKAYAMTGWRIGYAAGPREVIGAMGKVQSHATSNPCSIAQAAAQAALDGPQGEVERMSAEFARRRNFLTYRLRAIDGVSCDEPKGAFYVFPNMSSYFDRTVDGAPIRNAYGLSYYLLKHAHVAVVPGDGFGGPGHVRLSYATSMERLEEGMVRITRALERLERPRAQVAVLLDNVRTKVDQVVPTEVTSSRDAVARLTQEANQVIDEAGYYEWNASIGGIVVQLRTNSPHLSQFFMENWFPAQLESEIEPHAVIYGVKGIPGRQPSAVWSPEGRTGFVINTACYGQVRTLALAMAADVLERMSGVHLLRAAALDVAGKGVLLMGAPGSGMSRQLFHLLAQEGVRLVATDAVLVRHVGGRAMADLPERKLYMKTKWAKQYPKLAPIFDRSLLENAETEAHSNESCDGGERCAVTRGHGACYVASNASRAMLDPYWLGGAKRHTRRTELCKVAIFQRSPVGQAVQPLSHREAMGMLEHAAMPATGGSSSPVPWMNEYLLDRSAGRLDSQRQLFARLLEVAQPIAVNTAYADAATITGELRRQLV